MNSGRFVRFSSLSILILGLGFFAACDDGGDDKEPKLPDLPGQFEAIGPGKHCITTFDCAGSATCQNNFCAGSNLDAGLHCRTSSDCKGASICTGDVCTATDPSATVPDGGHCDTSGDCKAASSCSNGVCSSGYSLGRGLHCHTTADCKGVLTCTPIGSGPSICY